MGVRLYDYESHPCQTFLIKWKAYLLCYLHTNREFPAPRGNTVFTCTSLLILTWLRWTFTVPEMTKVTRLIESEPTITKVTRVIESKPEITKVTRIVSGGPLLFSVRTSLLFFYINFCASKLRNVSSAGPQYSESSGTTNINLEGEWNLVRHYVEMLYLSLTFTRLTAFKYIYVWFDVCLS